MTVQAGARKRSSSSAIRCDAGPINGELAISVQGSNLRRLSYRSRALRRLCRPVPSPPLQPREGRLTCRGRPRPRPAWPATSSRAALAAPPYARSAALATGTTAVEQTGTNATTFSYRVVAVASGVRPSGGPPGRRGQRTDSLAPPRRVGQHAGDRSTQGNVTPCRSPFCSPPRSLPSDTITVTSHAAARKHR